MFGCLSCPVWTRLGTNVRGTERSQANPAISARAGAGRDTGGTPGALPFWNRKGHLNVKITDVHNRDALLGDMVPEKHCLLTPRASPSLQPAVITGSGRIKWS